MVRQHVISSHRGEYVWVCAWMCVFWKTANLLNFHSLFGFCSPSAAAIPSVGVVHYSAQCFDNVRTFCCLSIVHVGVVACVHMLNVFGAWSVCQVARANRRWHKLIVGSLLQWFRKPAPVVEREHECPWGLLTMHYGAKTLEWVMRAQILCILYNIDFVCCR